MSFLSFENGLMLSKYSTVHFYTSTLLFQTIFMLKLRNQNLTIKKIMRYYHSCRILPEIVFSKYFSKIIGTKNNGRKNPATV